jgi:hypothetical protein
MMYTANYQESSKIFIISPTLLHINITGILPSEFESKIELSAFHNYELHGQDCNSFSQATKPCRLAAVCVGGCRG